MARALMQALEQEKCVVDLASDLVTRDGVGDVMAQQALRARAGTEVKRLIPQGRRAGWQVWITYHNYYKAPDLIGPEVARALNIPYVLIEATRAQKRLDGPWAAFARAAEAATEAADVVLYLTTRDGEALAAHRPTHQRLVHLRPFLPQSALPPETKRSGGILTVGMFRAGDKRASYQLIAETLAQLKLPDWRLDIAGDGPARQEVATLLAPFGDHVRFLGALAPPALQEVYQSARVLLWPGVNEAFGMTYLEAQATGLAVVAQDRPGVRDVLAPGAAYPNPQDGPAALAARLDLLMALPKLCANLGQSARRHVGTNHLMGTARITLRDALQQVLA